MRFTLGVLALLSCPLAASGAEQFPARGAALVHACAACHGPDGQSQGAIPSFQALSKERLVETLQAFRSDKRQGTVMNRIAKGLEDTDIEAIAIYMSKAHPRP